MKILVETKLIEVLKTKCYSKSEREGAYIHTGFQGLKEKCEKSPHRAHSGIIRF